MFKFLSLMPACVCICALARVADASPALDVSFGTGGLSIVNAGGASAELGASLQQSDGKIVVVGNSPALPGGALFAVPTADFLVARFNADGTPDTSFGSFGVVRVDFEGGEDAARSVAQQPDGKLVVAGWATRANDVDFAVVRLLPDGTLDSSFSDDGKQLVNFAFRPPPQCPPLAGVGGPCLEPVLDVDLAINRASGIALQSDGGMVVYGASTLSNSKALNFALLSAAGQLDPMFGQAHDGRVTVYLHTFAWGFAPPIVRTRNEAIVVGTSSSPSIFPFAGRIDLSAPSVVVNQLNASTALPETSLLLPDGRLLIAGTTIRGGSPLAPLRERTWLARADKELVLDTTFGTNGVFTTADPTDNDGILGLALERGGKILSAGYSTADRAAPESGVRATLRRFLAGGAPDPSFASGGVLQVDLSGGSAAISSRFQNVMTTADGQIVLAGMRGQLDLRSGRTFLDASSSRIVLARVGNTPTFEMRDDARQIVEGLATPTVEVSRLGETTGAVSVRYVIRAGTASSGTDFVAATGTLTWEAGDAASRSIPVQLVNDSVVETAETLIVELSEPSEGSITRRQTTVTIVDDDVVAPPPAPSPPPAASGGGGRIDLAFLLVLALATITVRLSDHLPSIGTRYIHRKTRYRTL
jgi:uncharacterized delta-60 repeat protein